MARRATKTQATAASTTGGKADGKNTSTIYAEVPAELHTAARIQAVKEGRPFSHLVADAVRGYLESVA